MTEATPSLIECSACDGHGFIRSPGRASGERECIACGGEGWRPMTDDKPTTPASGGAQEPADDAREARRILAQMYDAHGVPKHHAEHIRNAHPDTLAWHEVCALNAVATALKRSPAESGDGLCDGLEKAAKIATQISEREAGLANDMPAGGDWQKHQHASNVALDIACLIRVETLAGPTTPPAESDGAQATAVNAVALFDVREAMRILMLDQPTTGERTTYNDGFVQGISYAIGRIDTVLDPCLDRASLSAPASRGQVGREGVELLDTDAARLALWKAIQEIKIGNATDDKLIIANLAAQSVFLAASPHGGGR